MIAVDAFPKQNPEAYQNPDQELLEAVNAYARTNADIHEVPTRQTEYELDQPLASRAVNTNLGVEQELRGVVQAGSELFGVVKATALKNNHVPVEKFILTRFSRDGDRATIIGGISETIVDVGRADQADTNGMILSDDVSRRHFRIGVLDGRLNIQDLNSTNHTQLISPRDINNEIAEPQTEGRFGLKAAWRQARNKNQYTDSEVPVVKNPFNNFKMWAPESIDIEATVLEDKGPTQPKEKLTKYAQAELDKIQKKFDGDPDQGITQLAMKAQAIGESVKSAYENLSVSDNRPARLPEDVKSGLLQSTELMARSVEVVLRDIRYSGVIGLPEVQDALKAAFDLPILPSDTMPNRLDMNDEDEVYGHALMIQEELHKLEQKNIGSAMEPAIAHSLQRASHGLSVLLDKAARDPRTTNTIHKSLHYLDGNLASSVHYTGQLQQQSNTPRTNLIRR